jgi:hypothetical protein
LTSLSALKILPYSSWEESENNNNRTQNSMKDVLSTLSRKK